MSPPHSLFVSKSVLLHTSLAYISPELDTMDYVIRNAYKQSILGKVMLPTELLLLIREYLLPTITAQLIKRSTLALVSYEQSLRDLLCPDCVSYNLDIFGPDIWQWEQFNGACACVESVTTAGILTGSRNSIGHAKQSFPTYQEKSTSGPGTLDPKQFADASHWLESYLSREAALRVNNSRRVDQPDASGSPPAPTTDPIWNVVLSMLRDHGFEPLRGHDDSVRPRSHLIRRQFHFQRDLVQIFPLQHMARNLQDTSPKERDWQIQVTSNRAVKEMGLMLDYTNEFSAYGSHLIPPSHLLCWSSASDGCYKGQDMVDLSKSLLRLFVSLALACLSVPITFATLTVTILCFYSRPRGYRMF